jgi:hypothetical protein
MNPMVKVGAAAAAAVVVVLGITFLRAAPSGVGVPSASPTASVAPSPSPTAAVAPSVAATPAWDLVVAAGRPCGDVGCGGPLTAGTYTSRGLQPPVTYTLRSPWVNVRDWHEFFQLYPDTPANRFLAAAGRYPDYILVLPAASVSPTASCADDSVQDDIQVDAAQFADFLATQAGLQASRRIPVSIGGLDGLQVDVTVDRDWTGCLPGTPLGETADPADSYRFVVLDRPAEASLMIRMRTTGAPFQPFLEEAMPIVQSFQFDLTR